MDWFACNSCFVTRTQEKKFHMTSCGHIFCNNCIITSKAFLFEHLLGFQGLFNNLFKFYKGMGELCLMCSQKCSSFQLTNNLEPELNIYFFNFKDLLDMVRRQIMEFINSKQILLDKVYNFQQSHRNHLLQHKSQHSNDRLNEFNSKLSNANEKIKYLENENERFKQQIVQLQMQLQTNQEKQQQQERHANNDNSIFASIPTPNEPTLAKFSLNTPLMNYKPSNLIHQRSYLTNQSSVLNDKTLTASVLSNKNLNSSFNISTRINTNTTNTNTTSTNNNDDINYFTPVSNRSSVTLKNIENKSIRDVILKLQQQNY